MRVLIVDDERPAREKVRRLVESDPDVHVIHEAVDGIQAMDVIRSESPDIVFLDIQMPGMDGLRVLQELPEETIPHIVFVTAYDEYALSAFEVHAIDYLLKPFDAIRFQKAMLRAKAARETEQRTDEIRGLRQVLNALRDREAPLERLLVADGDRRVLIKMEGVVRIEAARNYIVLHAAGREYKSRSTIADIEQRLDPAQFVRVNRSVIVNVNFIVELTAAGHGDHDIRLRDGSDVRLSRTYKDRLRGWEA